METMGVRRLVLSMSVPIAAAMLLSAFYNVVDSAFVANYSDKALLAVSLCYPVQTVMIAVACGTAAGFNTVLSQSLGSGNMEKARQTFLHGILLSLFNWIVFALFGIFASKAFMSWFTQDPQVIAMGSVYLEICCLFSFAIFVEITYERILQAAADAMGNLIMQGAGAIINILLDPIFIFGFFGLPALGVAGAAIATILGQIIAMLIGMWLVKRRKIEFAQVPLSEFYFSWDLIKEIYAVGIPSILMQSIASLMALCMNVLLGQFSETAISAFGVISRLQQLIFMIVLGITNALIPITAYNYGAGLKKRILQIVHFSLLLSTLVMTAGMIAFEIFPEQLFSIFNSGPEMLAIGVPALRIISLSFVFAGISMILGSVFQAVGSAMDSLIVTLLRQLILLLPLVYVLALCFGTGICWWGFVISEAFCAGLSLFFWKRIRSRLHLNAV